MGIRKIFNKVWNLGEYGGGHPFLRGAHKVATTISLFATAGFSGSIGFDTLSMGGGDPYTHYGLALILLPATSLVNLIAYARDCIKDKRSVHLEQQFQELQIKNQELRQQLELERKIGKLDDQLLYPTHKKIILESLRKNPNQKYIELANLGEGGMGKVDLFWDVEREDYAAMKSIIDVKDPSLIQELLGRIRQEAELLARLGGQPGSQNLVEVYEIIEDTSKGPRLAMEFIKGKTLGDILGLPDIKGKRPNPLPPKQAVEIAKQLLAGLQCLHSQAIHRDISPDNIMLVDGKNEQDEGWVKLIDFGIVKVLRDPIHKTIFEGPKGKWNYMPLEAVAPDGIISTKSDIMSLGIVIYEMLTGELPFPEADNVIGRIRATGIKPNLKRAEIPAGLREILAKMFDDNPDKRPDHQKLEETFSQFLKS